ncbi:MAG: succinate dehydrogenase hydrophobic membrane anchor subunit [Chloroflexota bacterium]|nr:succinate dehydrogenase hydrophobic membrane anchor subunit [Chloroflexota bacterium]
MSLARAAARENPGSNFELWSWYYFRISGVLLLFLALGHVYVMHIATPVDEVNYAFVAARYAKPFWRTYDLILLLLAMSHGVNGVRLIVHDYVRSRSLRVFAFSVLYAAAAIFTILGALVILTFQPQAS